MFDLRDQLTVFLITTDGPTVSDCLSLIEQQELVRFRFDVVRNVAPMSAAFQQMNERCKTPFFVQVDEDMLLHTDAIHKLYGAMQACDEKTAIYFLSLFDRDLGVPIVGVKIYRHAVISQYPWQESFSCEMEQIERIKADGYSVKGQYKRQMGAHVVGEHYPSLSDAGLFERYMRLAQKMRTVAGNEGWGQWPGRFLDRVLRSSSRLHWYALFGWVAGILLDPEEAERDFRQEGQLEPFLRLQRYFGDLPEGQHEPVTAKPPSYVGFAPAIHPLPETKPRQDQEGPRELNVYTTSRCNLSCSFCGRQKKGKPVAPDVTVSLLRRALERWPSIESVCLAGFGEPLLCKHLGGLAMEALAEGKHTSLITNGLLLRESLERWPILRDLNQISVSLNASSKAEWAEVTGKKPEGFEKIVEAVRGMNKKPLLSYVVKYSNLSKVSSFLSLAEELGCRVDLLSLLPHGRSDEAFWRDALTDDDAAVRAMISGWREHSWSSKIRTWPVLLSRQEDRCPWSCNSPRVSVGIDGEGHLTPCRRIMGPDKGFGSLDQLGAWRFDGCDTWRESHVTRKNKTCLTCWGNWA